MARWLQHLTLFLSTGYIFYFFSEFMFWSGGKAGTWDPIEIFPTWLLYSLLAACFLTVVRAFHARSPWGLFLAGAVFGWMAEGIFVQTMVEQLPLSISFTGLAWHALITVWVGWYGLRRALLDERRWLGPLVSATIGLAWGLWAVSWWLEVDGLHRTPAAFGAVNLVGTLLFIVAHALFERCDPADFRPDRRVSLAIFAFFLVWFIVVAVPTAPWSAVVVPAALGLGVWALRRGQTNATGETDALDMAAPRVGRRLLWLLLMPLVATAVYAAGDAIGVIAYTNIVLYAVTMPLGFILFAVSVWRVGRKTQASQESVSISYSEQGGALIGDTTPAERQV